MALYDNYQDNVEVPEVVTPEEEEENNAFLDAITQTPVVQQAHAFLANKSTAVISLKTFNSLKIFKKNWLKVSPIRK